MDQFLTLAAFLLVGGLASFRLTRLVVHDDFPPILWLRDRLAGGYRPMTSAEQHSWADWVATRDLPIERQSPRPFVTVTIGDEEQRWVDKAKWSPFWLGDLVTCHWCASGWVSFGVVVVALPFTSVPLPVLTWLATWAIACLICERVDRSGE